MADNFNISLPGAAQGAAEVMGLGPGVAASAAKTLQDQQAVQQAIERTKQAGIATQEAQAELGTQGFLSEKGQVPKAQAIGELKIMLQKEGWEQADIDSAVDQAQSTWPDVVNAYDIRGFITALRQERQPTENWGPAFPGEHITDGKAQDVAGNPINKDAYYQQSDQGSYRLAGEPSAEVKAETAGEAGNEKEWQKLGQVIEGAIKSRYGVVGQLGTTVMRSLRALNTLHRAGGSELTKQDIDNISTDIAAIYQGGVPSITQITENSYGTTLTNLRDTLRHYTGVLSFMGNKTVLHDTIQKLTNVLQDMRNSAVAQMQQFIELQFPFYKKLIQSDPARWEEVKQAVLNFMTAGELGVGGETLPPSGQPTGAGPTPGGTVPAASAAAPQGQPQNDPLGIR